MELFTAPKIEYDKITWHRLPESKTWQHRVYYRGWVNGKQEYLHRYIYAKENGTIQKGIIIHHKDDNPFNNKPSNLIPITRSQHSKMHIDKNANQNNRHLEEARKLIITNKRKTKPAKIERTQNCEYCGKQYTKIAYPSRVFKYCSNLCGVTARYYDTKKGRSRGLV